MKRLIYKNLLKWKANKDKKPLILEGARQVGKTYIVSEFAKNEYKKFAYINFDNVNINVLNIFKEDLNVDRILLALSAEVGFKIDEDTLVFFDEIQNCEEAISSLKYFSEYKIKINVIVAGSLLGLSYNKHIGFPVGKVEFLKLYPLNFKEFLLANNEDILVESIENRDYEILKFSKSKLINYFKIFTFVGGMPEVVKEYILNKDFNAVKKIQNDILHSYNLDFSKHSDKNKLDKVRMTFNSIPSQLAKENKKFKYSDIKKGGRASDFEYAIEFLRNAGIIHIVNNVNKIQIPLSSYKNYGQFKIYLLDIGLLSNMNHIEQNIINDMDKIFVEYKGQLAEQFVLNELIAEGFENIFYYRDEFGKVEIDFMIEKNECIVPIEVKSGINLRAKSFNNFIEKYRVKKAIRYSLADYKENEIIEDVPLYTI